MGLTYDPFSVEPSSDKQKKRAFLIGKDPKSKRVQFLAKLALYRGQSINCYHLITGTRRKFSGRRDPDFERRRDEYIKIGHEIRYANDIPEEDVPRWVDWGKREAKRLGLEVAE